MYIVQRLIETDFPSWHTGNGRLFLKHIVYFYNQKIGDVEKSRLKYLLLLFKTNLIKGFLYLSKKTTLTLNSNLSVKHVQRLQLCVLYM